MFLSEKYQQFSLVRNYFYLSEAGGQSFISTASLDRRQELEDSAVFVVVVFLHPTANDIPKEG